MAGSSFADGVLLPVTAAIYRNVEENQQCVGPLKWKSEAKVTRFYLILFFEHEKTIWNRRSMQPA